MREPNYKALAELHMEHLKRQQQMMKWALLTAGAPAIGAPIGIILGVIVAHFMYGIP